MKNILIVEDNPIQRKNLRIMLQVVDEQFHIYEAESKDEALQIVKTASIQLFFIDILLKNSLGLDLAIEIRKMRGYEFTFIVFLTTHVEYLSEAFKKVHCYDYIIKPYDKDEIINMVKSFSLHLKSSAIIEKERKSTLFELENGTNLKVYIDEIIFVETNFRTCVLNTVRGLYMLKKMTLKKVLELTNQEFILQTHRSYLVNVKFISNIEKLDKRISQIHFDKYEGMALLSYTYRNNVLERLK